jgi:hypothetical protein
MSPAACRGVVSRMADDEECDVDERRGRRGRGVPKTKKRTATIRRRRRPPGGLAALTTSAELEPARPSALASSGIVPLRALLACAFSAPKAADDDDDDDDEPSTFLAEDDHGGGGGGGAREGGAIGVGRGRTRGPPRAGASPCPPTRSWRPSPRSCAAVAAIVVAAAAAVVPCALHAPGG